MTTSPGRLLALDVFRGMTVVFMIIVNSAGSWDHIFAPLQHAAWNGFTPTDLVFPSFLFAVGTSMSFSMRKWTGLGNRQVAGKILRRTALLFLFGFLMYWYPFFRLGPEWQVSAFPFAETRIFGVLQRIALAYGITAALLWFAGERVTYWICGLSLPVYWALLEFCGSPGLDPYALESNAVVLLDLRLFGPGHLYLGEGVPFDPEGLLSTLPCLANVGAGYALGSFAQKRTIDSRNTLRLLAAGLALCALAWIWNEVHPINKKLWTGSYATLTVGLDLMLISVLLWMLPMGAKERRWTDFFTIVGKNPLFIYLLSEVLLITLSILPAGDQRLWDLVYNSAFFWMGPKLGSFLMALAYMLLCWSVGWWLDKRRIYIKV
jgi:predicted acyltransferase